MDNTMQINTMSVCTEEIAPKVYIVSARANWNNKDQGRYFVHKGPKNNDSFTFQFTKDQAERLAAKVREAGVINCKYWISQ